MKNLNRTMNVRDYNEDDARYNGSRAKSFALRGDVDNAIAYAIKAARNARLAIAANKRIADARAERDLRFSGQSTQWVRTKLEAVRRGDARIESLLRRLHLVQFTLLTIAKED